MRRHPELTLPLAFFAFSLLDRLLTPEGSGSAAANLVAAALMTLPFAWRRTHPFAMVAALTTGAVFTERYATSVESMLSALVMVIATGFVLARHHEGRPRTATLLVAAVLLGGSEALGDRPAIAFVLLLLAGGAVGGALLRSRTRLTRELAERTHELEALRAARERDAVLDERRRIARELHDVVAHTVSVMVVQAGGARLQLRRDPQRAMSALDLVDATGREALSELDRLFGLLQSAGDAPSGLGDLPALVRRTREAGLETTLSVHGTPATLPADADLAAFRLVQEGLTNALKHAGAGATVAVTLHWQDGGVQIVVSDTGHGLDGERGEGSRSGLDGMRERLGAFGGDVQAGPRAGGGFEVRAWLPVGAREEVPA